MFESDRKGEADSLQRKPQRLQNTSTSERESERERREGATRRKEMNEVGHKLRDMNNSY